MQVVKFGVKKKVKQIVIWKERDLSDKVLAPTQPHSRKQRTMLNDHLFCFIQKIKEAKPRSLQLHADVDIVWERPRGIK